LAQESCAETGLKDGSSPLKEGKVGEL